MEQIKGSPVPCGALPLNLEDEISLELRARTLRNTQARQWFQQGQFCLPHHPVYLAISKDIFDCHNLGDEGCHWHLMGTEQGCCTTIYNTPDSSYNKEFSGPKCYEYWIKGVLDQRKYVQNTERSPTLNQLMGLWFCGPHPLRRLCVLLSNVLTLQIAFFPPPQCCTCRAILVFTVGT